MSRRRRENEQEKQERRGTGEGAGKCEIVGGAVSGKGKLSEDGGQVRAEK